MRDRDGLAALAADLGGALRFFSRIPVPPLSAADDPAALPAFARAARAVPLAGAILALPPALLAAILAGTDLPPLASGALVVAAAMAVTGALHEDGLSDTADGLFGAHGRERRLEIMRDSRIGAFGAAALVLALLLRAALAGALVGLGAAAAALALLAAAAVGRGAMVAVWHALPAARADGLSAGAGRPERGAARVAIGTALALSVLAVPAGGYGGLVLGLALAGLAALLLARAARRAIGGQTGDVLGAVQQVAEIAFLLALLA